MQEERNFLVTQLNTTNKINIFSFLPSTKVLLIIITLPNHIYIYIYSAIRLKIRRVPRKTFEAEPLFRETRSGQEEHWQGKTYRLSRIRSCSYLMARSREPQADGYNGIVCTQKTERYYSERERERGLPRSFSQLDFVLPRSFLSLSFRETPFLRLSGCVHIYTNVISRQLARIVRKTRSMKLRTHSTRLRIFSRGVSINTCENYITIRSWGK